MYNVSTDTPVDVLISLPAMSPEEMPLVPGIFSTPCVLRAFVGSCQGFNRVWGFSVLDKGFYRVERLAF